MGLFSFLSRKKTAGKARQTSNLSSTPPPSPTAPINPIARQQQEAAAQAPGHGPTQQPTAASAAPVQEEMVTLSAEDLCGIDPDTMDRDAIRAHLAMLYRRHNAAAASLDADLRAEAELMLDAIVACREAYVDSP